MFSWCFTRQNSDDDEYRPRPKTRNAFAVPSTPFESREAVKTLQDLQNEILEAHNKYREKHGVSPLTLNKQLCSFATEWAKHLAKTNTLQHRKNNKYGENLFMTTGTGTEIHVLAVQAWYDEIKNYNFNKPGFSPINGHFTQVIWKTSKELGVGIETRNNRTWIVCNYDPPGNVMGRYEKNVPPLIEETVSKIIDKMKPKKLPYKSSLEQLNPSLRDLNLWSPYELEYLEVHNKYRAIHGSPALTLDRILCGLAQDWAKYLSQEGALSHRPSNIYGENIYYAMHFQPTAEDCVKSWYDEIKNYDYSKPGFSSKTGHFTQVVWRNTTELGVGISTQNFRTFVVCNYAPAGNVAGQFEAQVPRPGERPCSTNIVIKSQSDQQQQGQQSFEEVCLNSHNDFRAIHGSPAMKLNKNLSFFASDWAQVRTTQISYTTRTTKTTTTT